LSRPRAILSVARRSMHSWHSNLPLPSGKILITGSIAAPGSFNAVYNGTKAFLNSFAFAIREELKGTPITVTCLMPRATETEFFRRADMLDTKIGTREGWCRRCRQGWLRRHDARRWRRRTTRCNRPSPTSRPPKLWPSSIATRRRRAPVTPAEPFADDVRQLDRPRRCLKLKQRRLFLEFAGTLHLERLYRFQSSPSQE
jgi:NAD(P)-dependent dehydrogenase (short-subunit alcohol dehydrogenase family)